MSKGTVLITGAAGFVGQALVSGFAMMRWRVIAVDRAFASDSATPGAPADSTVTRIGVDLGRGEPLDVPRADLIIHGAWVTTDPESLGLSATAYATLNVRPLLTMLEHSAKNPPNGFVFLSSSGVFGETDGQGRLTDRDPPTGSTPYARAKRAGETLTKELLPPATDAHVVRLGYLYGPNEWPSSHPEASVPGCEMASVRPRG